MFYKVLGGGKPPSLYITREAAVREALARMGGRRRVVEGHVQVRLRGRWKTCCTVLDALRRLGEKDGIMSVSIVRVQSI